MTSGRVYRLLARARALPTLEWIYFEGGEPFLVYPLLLRSVHIAHGMGFKVGIISNGFFARTEEAAIRYLQPLQRIGLDELQISNDAFHYRNTASSPASRALAAAVKLDIPVARVRVISDLVQKEMPGWTGEELLQPLKWIGRAAEKLSASKPGASWESYDRCPCISLGDPERLYIDPRGNVQICQGISIGNAFESPLEEVLAGYEASSHPICGPLLRDGPAGLARRYDLQPDQEPGDACLLCYSVRKRLVQRFPEHLAPASVYNFSR